MLACYLLTYKILKLAFPSLEMDPLIDWLQRIFADFAHIKVEFGAQRGPYGKMSIVLIFTGWKVSWQKLMFVDPVPLCQGTHHDRESTSLRKQFPSCLGN